MIITVSVRVCYYKPWNHIPLAMKGDMCDDRLHFRSCQFRAWTMEPIIIAELHVGARSELLLMRTFIRY